MMESAMKALNTLMILLLVTGLWAAAGAEPGKVEVVYLLPMGNGLDQYLAGELTRQNVLQVVTDPAQADAVLTDQIGKNFEKRFEELFPPPKPAGEESEEAAPQVDQGPVLAGPGFSRGKGNLFLVDRRTRRILWATYEVPRDSTTKELHRSAGRIAERLKKELSVR